VVHKVEAPATEPGAEPVALPSRGRPRPGRRATAAVAAALTLTALAGWLAVRRGAPPARPAPPAVEPYVAVLPFATPPGDAEAELLALSIADLLGQRLAAVPGLRFENPDYWSPSGAARRAPTRSRWAITGRIERAASPGRGRLSLELLERDPSGTRRSSLGEYELPFLGPGMNVAEFLRVRDALARQLLTMALPAMRLAPEPRLTPLHPEAYRLYLTATSRLRQVACLGPAGLEPLERSLELAPDFAPAWEELGWARYNLVSSCGESGENYPRAAAAAEQALRLMPRRARATCLQAVVLAETGQAERAYVVAHEAAERQPNDLDLVYAEAYVLTYAGFLDHAAALLERALAADPMQATTLSWSLNAFLHQQRPAHFLRLLRSSEAPFYRYYRGYAEVLLGRENAARQTLSPAFRTNPADQFARLAQALLAILEGRPEEAQVLLRQLVLQRRELGSGDGEMDYKIALLLARSGAAGEAIEQLERAVEQGFVCSRCIELEPGLRPLRGTERFGRLLDAARLRQRAFAERFGLPMGEGRS
jgi:tetratricopeptide (TPR) repeat protein